MQVEHGDVWKMSIGTKSTARPPYMLCWQLAELHLHLYYVAG